LTDLVDKSWHNDPTNIIPKFSLEFQTAFGVKEEVSRQATPVVPETLVERVITHGPEPISDGREQIVEMILILRVIKLSPSLFEVVASIGTLRLENIAWLQEDLESIISYFPYNSRYKMNPYAMNVVVDFRKPILESLVTLRIVG
jgi:hypothetical protein